jgi:hypothetical protein
MWFSVFRHLSTKLLTQSARVEHGKFYIVTCYCVTFRWKARPEVNYVACNECNPSAGKLKGARVQCKKPETCFKLIDTGLMHLEFHEVTEGRARNDPGINAWIPADLLAQGGLEYIQASQSIDNSIVLPCKRTEKAMNWYEGCSKPDNVLISGVPDMSGNPGTSPSLLVAKAPRKKRKPASLHSPGLRSDLPASALAGATSRQEDRNNASAL